MSYTPQSLSVASKPWKPHTLNKEEEKEISEDEKKVLCSMPVEKDSIWVSQARRDGKGEFWWTLPVTFKDKAPIMFAMLENTMTSDVSHIVFGGFRYAKATDKILRSVHQSGGGSSYGSNTAKFTPKYCNGIFAGDQDHINDFLNEPENKNKWTLIGEWKFHPEHGYPVFALQKTSS